MAVIKKKWSRLVSDLGIYDKLSGFVGYIDAIEVLRGQVLGVQDYTETISSLYEFVTDSFFKYNPVMPKRNLWNDLDIFLSSYKEYDSRIITLIHLKLQEYLGFYKKMLEDKGVSRALLYSKNYQNLANSMSETSRDSTQNSSESNSSSLSGSNSKESVGSSTKRTTGNKNELGRKIHSETPQNSALYDSQTGSIGDALFDQAIADYASSLDRNKVGTDYQDNEGVENESNDTTNESRSETGNSSLSGSQKDSASGSTETTNEGSSATKVTGTTWEESRKNLDLVFYNELKDYIFRLPELVYSYYSIDTKPFTDLYKDFIQYIESLESQE